VIDRELHQRASDLFLELRELSRADQEPRLDQIPDPHLKQEVLELLRNDVPPTHSLPVEQARPDLTHATSTSADIPTSIGPYSILRRLGRGGSGYVLLAEQHQPIHRHVAIKIVPYAAIDPESAARFEFERRALERTDHPNIARILDAGKTGDGLPYLVIEYVEGKPLGEYCRGNSLSIRDRISLILDIADAVQHAHQRGVIHRDLKPANILVSETSGRPIPRILDFGIAKPTDSFSGSDGNLAPTSGIPIGTPAYMAPEQTGGRSIDTRADIYALGAVLYDLITGRPPIDTTGGPLEVFRRIKESMPAPASRVLQGMENPESVSRAFLADLDCILDKSLEKDPLRRYQTVGAFSEDLRRLLRRVPILAHPPTLSYRASRFIQRNRLLVSAAAVVILTAGLGVGGLAIGLFEATRQRREAGNQTDAQREINRFLTDDILAAASPDKEGHEITALDLLERASARIQSRFPDRPLIAAAIHHTIGVAFSQLGSFDNADRHLATAVSLRRAHAGPNAPDTVRSEIAAASLLARREIYDRAEPDLRTAIDRARLILGADDPALYSALNDLGTALFTLGRGKEAVGVLQESLAGAIRLLGEKDAFVLEVTSNLAQAYDMAGDPDRSLAMHLDALRVAESIPDPPRMIMLGLNNNIGATYQGMNRDREAAPYLRRASELGAKWLREDNPDRWTLQGNLASLEAELGNPELGAKLYEEVIAARIRLMGADSHDTMSARYGYWNCLWIGKRFDEAAAGYKALLPDVARARGETNWLTIQTRSSLARALNDGGHPEDALPYAEQAASQFLSLNGADHPRTKNAQGLLADIRRKLGQ
jgi:eukaryotic-like serine/threonine-protein kinase